MARFTPVVLIDKDGLEFTAHTPVTLNDLVGRGYTRKNSKGQVPDAEAVKPAPVEPEVTESSEALTEPAEDSAEEAEKPESAVRKPVQTARVSRK